MKTFLKKTRVVFLAILLTGIGILLSCSKKAFCPHILIPDFTSSKSNFTENEDVSLSVQDQKGVSFKWYGPAGFQSLNRDPD